MREVLGCSQLRTLNVRCCAALKQEPGCVAAVRRVLANRRAVARTGATVHVNGREGEGVSRLGAGPAAATGDSSVAHGGNAVCCIAAQSDEWAAKFLALRDAPVGDGVGAVARWVHRNHPGCSGDFVALAVHRFFPFAAVSFRSHGGPPSWADLERARSRRFPLPSTVESIVIEVDEIGVVVALTTLRT